MKKLLIAASIFGAFVFGFVGYSIGNIETVAPPANASSVAEKSPLEYINQIRTDRGAAPLTTDAGLNNTAKAKVQDMIARQYWDHTTPDGEPFNALIQKNRPGLERMGENLAECFKTTQATFDGWLASPGHLANMINRDYDLYGSYTEYDPATKCFVTANHFGKEFVR